MKTIGKSNTPLAAAYRHCETLARSHYENFPVASLFLPKKIRQPTAVIYTFARQADDIADEGDLSVTERLEQLDHYWQSLEDLGKNSTPRDPVFIALKDVLRKHPQLPITLFFDLLTAFKQDVLKNRYENFQEILDYCRYSANPVGRLLLHLTNNATAENLENSDAICTALQLINFLQDLHSDLNDRNRCYLPQDEMRQLRIELEILKTTQESPDIQKCIKTQLIRAQDLLEQGSPLGNRLQGLFGFEIRLTLNAARKIISALTKRKSVYARPKITALQWPAILWASLHFSN